MKELDRWPPTEGFYDNLQWNTFVILSVCLIMEFNFSVLHLAINTINIYTRLGFEFFRFVRFGLDNLYSYIHIRWEYLYITVGYNMYLNSFALMIIYFYLYFICMPLKIITR